MFFWIVGFLDYWHGFWDTYHPGRWGLGRESWWVWIHQEPADLNSYWSGSHVRPAAVTLCFGGFGWGLGLRKRKGNGEQLKLPLYMWTKLDCWKIKWSCHILLSVYKVIHLLRHLMCVSPSRPLVYLLNVFFVYLSPFERRFWTFLPLGLLSLPTQWMPPGPVTLCDSRPFDDFLKVNSTASPSFRLRKPSMCSLLWQDEMDQR